MAFADYHICDHCGERKTFYDADHNTDWDAAQGEWVYDSIPSSGGVPGLPGYRVYALCRECSKTHKIVIVPQIEEPTQ
jgi:hypothetical protein